MNDNFIIKKINRVILVEKNEYQEKNTTFIHNLKSNELILHISGKAQVKFNGKILNCESGTIRFLPKGENKEYIVEREEHGECFDVFFDTDVPISDEAFVLNVKNSIKIENLFKKLFSVWVSKNEGYYFESISLFILKRPSAEPVPPTPAFIHSKLVSGYIFASSLVTSDA